MAPTYLRGGLPQHINETATTAVLGWNIAIGTSNYLWFKNTGSNLIVLTLTDKTDADAGLGISVEAGTVWEGPAEIGSFCTKADGGISTFEAVAYRVRG